MDEYPYDFYAAAGATITASITTLPTDVPIMLRIKCAGSSTEYCYIDDIEVCYENTWEPEVPEFEPGDVDNNGIVNIDDVTTLIDYLLGTTPSEFNELAADVDGDGKINIDDVTTLIDILLGSH